jgi:hypothetical protein
MPYEQSTISPRPRDPESHDLGSAGAAAAHDSLDEQALSEVSNILWRERQLLELLTFKLEEEQLVLAAGRTRWLSHATREVETVLGEIKRVELDRAVHVEALARSLGFADTPSLREIGEVVAAPWDRIFDEHRHALLEAAHDIDAVAKSNRDLLSRGQTATREALAALGEVEIDAYTPTGSTPERSLGMRLVDEAM